MILFVLFYNDPEYVCIIWKTRTSTHCNYIEGVQNKMLSFISYDCNVLFVLLRSGDGHIILIF